MDQLLLSISSPIAYPVPPPAFLAACLSSPPPPLTSSSPTLVDSDNDDTDVDNLAFPISCDITQHICLPNGTQVLSSPTQVLSQPGTMYLTPAGPLTKCFHCHLLSHYHKDFPSYTCSNCHPSTPGHPASACLTSHCDLCHS